MKPVELADEAATAALARRMAEACGADGLVIYLEGELGAGKSSFARAFLAASGVTGRIKSPTYSLVEPYPLGGRTAWHLDLYRIADPGELEWLGLDALGDPLALVLVEWPSHGRGALPAADLVVRLAHAGTGRRVAWQACTARGRRVLAGMASD